LALKLEKMQREWMKFMLKELPEDRPAAIFAKNDAQCKPVVCPWLIGKRRRYI